MGILDKIKELIGGNKSAVKGGIDKASDAVESKVGTDHAQKVEGAAEKAKDVVDKLPGDEPTDTGSETDTGPRTGG